LATGTIGNFVRLARPKQWVKGLFVLLGPAYGFADGFPNGKPVHWVGVVLAVAAFALASSGCYIINDIRDRDADRNHPRKCKRPIASGAVSVPAARVFAAILLVVAGALAVLPVFAPGLVAGNPLLPVTEVKPPAGSGIKETGAWLAISVALYVGNVIAYSLKFKQIVMLDVVSLATGFVLRVLGGCAAGGVEPSTWLLNTTLFVSMFLAFSKRLGERRSLGEGAAAARGVLAIYTDDLLRMAVVVTAVATLVTYAGYVQARDDHFMAQHAGPGWGFNQLWPTIIPATFGLLRCIVLVERGRFDDPTELAFRDWGCKAAALTFGVLTAWAVWAAKH
jgi:4-hydroxybenzoate polyprenyltransferase